MSSMPKDPGDDLGSESEALFRAARSDHAPSVADRERVRRALAERLQCAPASELAAKVAPRWRANVSHLLKLGMGVTLVAAAGFAVKRVDDARKSRSEASAVQAIAPRANPALPLSAAAPHNSEPLLAPQPLTTAAPALSLVDEKPLRTMPARSREMRGTRREASGASSKSTAAESAKTARPSVRRPRSSTSVSQEDVAAGAGSQLQETKSLAPAVRNEASSSAEEIKSRPLISALPAPTAQKSASSSAARPQPLAAPRPTLRNEASGKRATAAAAHTSETLSEPEATDARAELVLVRKMQAAMLDEQPEEVLALGAEHSQRWPRGTFVQERQGLRAIALCKVAADNSIPQARHFLEQYPRTPLRTRVREACKLPIDPTK